MKCVTLGLLWTSSFGSIQCGYLISDYGGAHRPAFESRDTKVKGVMCTDNHPTIHRGQTRVHNDDGCSWLTIRGGTTGLISVINS